MDMESDPEPNMDSFRMPDQPKHGLGGKRQGSGRKKLHEGGYKRVKDLLWRTLSIHTDVQEEWIRIRDQCGFKNNSDFAANLLEGKKSQLNNPQTQMSSVFDEQRIATSASPIRDFFPRATSTPQRAIVRNEVFPTAATPNTTEETTSRTIRHKVNERVFIDSVIANQSFYESIGDNSDDDSKLEDMDDSGSSGEEEDEQTEQQLSQLDISFDDQFLSHQDSPDDNPDCGNDDGNIQCDATTYEAEDMDISITSLKEIETNIPAPCLESAEGLVPSKLLLQPQYETAYAADTQKELELITDRKFICSLSKLQELFQFCHQHGCALPLIERCEKWIGCTLEIRWKCECGHCGEWFSSHTVNRVHCNNLHAASSLLFTGNNFTKLSLFCKCFNLAWIGESTFVNYQSLYLAPVVHTWWEKMPKEIFDAIGEAPVSVCDDGQMDSPGHCAKTCTYTLMHTSLDYILHMEVVDVRHAQMKSSVMEKVGCQRSLDAVQQKLNVVEVVTDACSQIIKLLACTPQYKDITHQLDVWHKSNKLNKRLHQASKQKGNSVLVSWIAAIRNHFWHCAKQCNGDLFEIKNMWVNVLKHCANEHKWFGGECSHGPLEDLSSKDWIQPDSATMQALRDIVLDKAFLKSLPYYVNFRHTGKLESYHSHRLMYTPKRFSFSYEATVARSLLAVIDHNHHLHRNQARNKNNELIYTKRWSKRGQRWKVVAVQEKKNYSYLPYLCALVLKARENGSQPLVHANNPKLIAPNIAKLPGPPTSLLVQQHQTRF